MWSVSRARGAGGLLIAFALACLPPQASSQQPPASPVVVVVVDMTQIMRDAKAAKDIQAQVQKEMDAYSKEVSKKEDELNGVRGELERQRTVLAPDAFNAKSQEYQQRYAALDREVQARRQEMQQSYSETMTKVETVALQIIADVAKERKASMVVAKAALLYMDDALDVTAEVTRRLDAKLPALALSPPKAGGDTAASPKTVAAPAK
ncbi:MAG TPA: OmpH family outer membrane protein [Stellaceae bacterium]|nr:OmpH family outer membrane protein [Stellaceae bacterium]